MRIGSQPSHPPNYAIDNWTSFTGLPFDTSMSIESHIKAYHEIGTFFPSLLLILGGLKKVYELPVLTLPRAPGSYISFLEPKDMPFPIMRGIANGRPFIAFRYEVWVGKKIRVGEHVDVLHQTYNDDKFNWSEGGDQEQVNMRSTPLPREGTDSEIIMERLHRFTTGEHVGFAQPLSSGEHPPGVSLLSTGYYEQDPAYSSIKLWSNPRAGTDS